MMSELRLLYQNQKRMKVETKKKKKNYTIWQGGIRSLKLFL